jgi:hypothetical protein
MAEIELEQPKSRSLEIVSGELQRRLDDASSGLERQMVQQAAYGSRLNQIQSDLNAALALGREVKGLVEQRAEVPGVAATLQAAVEKTRETVVGQAEHVRERAVAAFHRIKGEKPSEDGGRTEDRP